MMVMIIEEAEEILKKCNQYKRKEQQERQERVQHVTLKKKFEQII